MILAYDLATQTGVAFGRPGEAPTLRTYRLGETQGQKFAQAMIMSRKLFREVSPDLVVLEAPLAGGKTGPQATPETAMGIRGCVKGMAFIEGVPKVEQYHAATVRKHFLGHGGLKRQDAKIATLRRCRALGWNPANDDEADAAALWDYACAMQRAACTAPIGSLFDR